jgi:hypothetical protein
MQCHARAHSGVGEVGLVTGERERIIGCTDETQPTNQPSSEHLFRPEHRCVDLDDVRVDLPWTLSLLLILVFLWHAVQPGRDLSYDLHSAGIMFCVHCARPMMPSTHGTHMSSDTTQSHGHWQDTDTEPLRNVRTPTVVVSALPKVTS